MTGRLANYTRCALALILLAMLSACQPTEEQAGNAENASTEPIDPYALNVGTVYVASAETPLLSAPNATQGTASGTIPAGGEFEVTSISDMEGTPYYYVEHKRITGWVRAEDLAKQQLRYP